MENIIIIKILKNIIKNFFLVNILNYLLGINATEKGHVQLNDNANRFLHHYYLKPSWSTSLNLLTDTKTDVLY